MENAAAGADQSFRAGLEVMFEWLSTPVSLAYILAGISLWWLGMIEVELMDKYGAKPDIERH